MYVCLFVGNITMSFLSVLTASGKGTPQCGANNPIYKSGERSKHKACFTYMVFNVLNSSQVIRAVYEFLSNGF